MEEYRDDFIQEWNFYQDRYYKLTIKYFLKCIINHTGYSSCERYCIHGTYERRIVFNKEIMYALREDAAFRLRNYVDHQRVQLSPLANIIEIINVRFRLHASCLLRGRSTYLKLSKK